MANKILKRLSGALGLGILCLAPGAAHADGNGYSYSYGQEKKTCTSVASANWNSAGTWSCGRVPLVEDKVVIAAGHAVTVTANATGENVDMSGASASTITIISGYTLTVAKDITMDGASLPTAASHLINVGAGALNVGGDLLMTGGVNISVGTGPLNVGGKLELTAGTVANSARVTRGTGTITIGGDLEMDGATIVGDTGAVTIGGDLKLDGATIAVGASGPISVTGSLEMTGGAGVPGAVLSIGTNGVMTVGDDIDIKQSGANPLISFTGSGGTLNVGGDVSSGASLAPGSGTVDYNGAANQTLGTYAYNNLTLSGSGTKTFPNTAMTIGGNLTLSGTAIAKPKADLTVNGNLVIAAGTTFFADVFTHNIKGNYTGGGTLTPDQGTFNFNGTSPQTLAGPATFYNLTLNNTGLPTPSVTASDVITILGNFTNTAGFTAGTSTVVFSGGDVSTLTGVTTFNNLTIDKSNKELTLNDNASVSGILTLTNLNIITGANTLAMTSTGSVTRDPVTGGHVIGNMSRHFPAGDAGAGVTRDFAIGTSDGYTPVSMTFYSVTTAGSMTAKTTLLDHPQIDTSVIDPDLDVNLYWTLSKGLNIVFDVADVTFNFTVDDLDKNAIPQNFIVQSYTPDIWGNTMLLELGDTYTRIGNVKTFGEFAVGQSTLVNFLHEKEFVYTRELY